MEAENSDSAERRPNPADEEQARLGGNETLEPLATCLDPSAGHLPALAPRDALFTSGAPYLSPTQSPDNLPVGQIARPGPPEAAGGGQGGNGYNPNDGDEKSSRITLSSPPLQASSQRALPSSLQPLHPRTTKARRVETPQKEDGMVSGAADDPVRPGRASQQPPDDQANLIEEARRGLIRMLVAGIRTATYNPIMGSIGGYIVSALLLLAMCYVGVFLILRLGKYLLRYLAKEVVTTILVDIPGDLLGVVGSAVRPGWDWSCVALKEVRAYGSGLTQFGGQWSWHGMTYWVGTYVGWIPPTVLPPLDAEHTAVATLQNQPLAYVDGMILAQRVVAPHQRELQRFRDDEPGTSPNQLRFAAGEVVLQAPFVFDTALHTRLEALAAANERLGQEMRRSLETERTALLSFRRLLREQPASSEPCKSANGTWWDSVWQKAQAMLRSTIVPPAQRQLLSRVAELESTLNTGLAARMKWARHLSDSEMSRIGLLEVPFCEASDYLRGARWMLEAKVDALPPSTASDDDGSHVSASSSSSALAKAELTSGLLALQGAQAGFAQMCVFAKADRKAATDVISKLAVDKKWYRGALESLENVRARIKADPLTDPAKVVGLEREMDEIALSMLEGIKYWEERQRDG